MKIIRMPVFAILILSAIPYLVSCSSETQPASAENKKTSVELKSPSTNNSANNPANDSADKAITQVAGKAIELPHYQPDFPSGEGKDLFISRCGVCHSLRYITMQPDFPKRPGQKKSTK